MFPHHGVMLRVRCCQARRSETGNRFAFGRGARSLRAQRLVREAERLTGTNVARYVDDVTYSPGSSYFDLINGRRVMNIGSDTFAKTRTGQLIDAAHEIGHAQKWHHTLHYKHGGNFGAAFDEFFIQKPFGSAGYSFDEVIAESLAIRRINRAGIPPAEGSLNQVH